MIFSCFWEESRKFVNVTFIVEDRVMILKSCYLCPEYPERIFWIFFTYIHIVLPFDLQLKHVANLKKMDQFHACRIGYNWKNITPRS